MRILFLPLITRGAAIGTITRCLAVADHLRLLGHDCFFLTNGAGAEHVTDAGFPYLEGKIPEPPGPHVPLRDLSDVAVFLNLTREDYLRQALAAEQGAVDRFRPDVLFSEFKLTASITAAVNALPLVSTACSPADPRFVSELPPTGNSLSHDEAARGFNKLLDERSLPLIRDVAELFFTRSTVKVAPTIPELEPLLADVKDLHYVGYLLYDRWELEPLPEGLLQQAHGKKLVFVYLSTGEIGPAQYTRVLPEAFHNTEFHAIVAVGDHPEQPELPQSTANTTWVHFVPGRSILRCSQAVIFHGGQNTAMAALLHKVPSLAFPGQDFERDFNARSIARIGAGLHYPAEDFTPSKVLQAVRDLLNPSYALANESYSWKVLQQGGPRYAADLVLSAGTMSPRKRES